MASLCIGRNAQADISPARPQFAATDHTASRAIIAEPARITEGWLSGNETGSELEQWAPSLSPAQCRAARERLNWSEDDLARAAQVPVDWVIDFEKLGEGEPDIYPFELRDALEAVGIGFPFVIESGHKNPAGVTYSPPDRQGTH